MTELKHPLENHQLQAYLDHQLEPGQAELIRVHIESCSECKQELVRLENLQLRLHSLPDIRLSRDLSRQVISQLEEERSLSPAITWTILLEAAAAGIVIGALIPAMQAAGWLPSLLDSRLKLQAALNIFLAQLASSWLVWWTGLKLQTAHILNSFLPLKGLSFGGFSPWLIMGIAGSLLVVLNGLLLGQRSPLDRRHNRF